MDPSTATQDLAAIRRLMDESQRAVRDGGEHFVAWGLAVALGLVATYAALVGWLRLDTRWVWAMVFAAGWSFSLWMGRRERARARVTTLAGALLGAIWLGVSITITILVVAGLSTSAIPGRALSGLTSIVLAGGFFASSYMLGTWLRYIALAWWAGGVALLYWPGPHGLLVLGVMMIALQVVPGLVLLARSTRAATPGG